MIINTRTYERDDTPEIYAAISLVFNKTVDVTSVIDELKHLNLFEFKICEPKYEATTCLDIVIVQNEHFWELNDALTKMFSKVAGHLRELKQIATKYQGEVLIDIAIYQHGNYPAIVISGQNMKNIHFLEANISIDLL